MVLLSFNLYIYLLFWGLLLIGMSTLELLPQYFIICILFSKINPASFAQHPPTHTHPNNLPFATLSWLISFTVFNDL